MKKLIVLFFVAVCAICVRANDDEGAKIVFSAKVHDFGTIDESKDYAVTEFEFTNEGTAPLVIIDATASCGCTRPEYPQKPIAPGKKGKIKVKFNPKGQPSSFSKVVTVITNDPKAQRVKLRIKGKIKK